MSQWCWLCLVSGLMADGWWSGSWFSSVCSSDGDMISVKEASVLRPWMWTSSAFAVNLSSDQPQRVGPCCRGSRELPLVIFSRHQGCPLVSYRTGTGGGHGGVKPSDVMSLLSPRPSSVFHLINFLCGCCLFVLVMVWRFLSENCGSISCLEMTDIPPLKSVFPSDSELACVCHMWTVWAAIGWFCVFAVFSNVRCKDTNRWMIKPPRYLQ